MTAWKSLFAATAVVALTAAAAPAKAAPYFEIVNGNSAVGGDANTVPAIDGVNGFEGENGDAFGLHLTRNVSRLIWTFIGSESGFNNQFTGPDGVTRDEVAFTFETNNNKKGLIDFSFTSGGVTPDTLNNGDVQPIATNEGGTSTDMSLFLAMLDADGSRFGNNALIGFDDGGGSNDDNHDDYVLSVQAIPVPATLLLLGAGLIGLGAVGRARKTA